MSSDLIVFSHPHFTVEQSSEYPIPGYLILRPTPAPDSLSQLTPDSAKTLGSALSLSYACIEAIINPDVIYCARFGEKVRALHFHLFPRCSVIAAAYRKAHDLSETQDISGPHLLDWIMNQKPHLTFPLSISSVLPLLKKEFQTLSSTYLK